MPHALDALLDEYRAAARGEREKGTYFERLARAYLASDPIQAEEIERVWTWADWARENGRDARDTGIDLVAKLRGGDGFAAVQAKFRAADARIRKSDIDSFISASGKSPFSRRIIVDTTEGAWSDNAEEMIRGQSIPVSRIGLSQMRESGIDWGAFAARGEVAFREKKAPRPHQLEAINKVREGLATTDRGKLIMACGTGKTFTALKIAEAIAGRGGRVLYMVPSLALMSQTIREWKLDAEIGLRSFAVCSDAQVGKRRRDDGDVAEIEVHDLEFPATTRPGKLAKKAAADDAERMTVVFSTYQSLPVISAAQKRKKDLKPFDLIICDEAHRTTGAIIEGEDASNFVRVHDNAYVNGAKRLYMTATPRIYGDKVKAKAADASITLYAMDDEALYGPTFFTMGFGQAVEKDLLSDYKVVVLAMDEGVVSRVVQERRTADSELRLDDATKIVGCYRALQKQGQEADDFTDDKIPMRRAIAFCRDIRSSKLVAEEFATVVDEYNSRLERDASFRCKVSHVDGGFNAKARGELLHWLGEDSNGGCKILSNARCLSEGVDVPNLDAILFMHPRKSQIEIVQGVGRVMRRAPGKKLGYVILPIVIPAGIPPEMALNDNERYRVVWQVLNALRSHDERFDGMINGLGPNSGNGQIEVIAIADKLPAKRAEEVIGDQAASSERDDEHIPPPRPDEQIRFIFDEFPAAIRAKIVKKCGQRTYWEDWAKDVGEIARTHITRITAILENGGDERNLFDEFLAGIRQDLNSAISDEEAVEMLAQHLVTKPVFDALFDDRDFTGLNPVSRSMQALVDALQARNLRKEAKSLEGFYASVKRRAAGVDDVEAKQRIIVELYDKFFRTAFPKLTERLGIVYTPVEVVDFIIHSANDILQREFGQTLGSEGVHIIDPFTGTGTFITRMLQSGLIAPEEIKRKYGKEIHANEIVLLAYYIAAINIENVYHGLSGADYTPFDGICLTDTFDMHENKGMEASWAPVNNKRRQRQKELGIKVIIGNPPYSVGQRSEDDGAKNTSYPTLDASIRDSYAAESEGRLKRNLYDSYIRAVRWASNRIGPDGGIVGFVAGNGWLEKAFADGMRKCLREECSRIYVVNLRGDIRKNMLSGGAAREGENMFGQASMTGIAIFFLVKNPQASNEVGEIYYHDIGDDLNCDEKRGLLSRHRSIGKMLGDGTLTRIIPNRKHDWINQRDDSFAKYIAIGNKENGATEKIFENYTQGIVTSRDSWCCNASQAKLKDNINVFVREYNKALEKGADNVAVDSAKISWSRSLKADLRRKKRLRVNEGQYVISTHRPFSKQWLFYSRRLNEVIYQTHKIFPQADTRNRTIAVSGIGARSGFSCLMCDAMPNYETIASAQHFPLKLFEENGKSGVDLLSIDGSGADYKVRDGVSHAGLKHFRAAYGNPEISKEDVFYYVYGLLHSEVYRSRFANNLVKEMPRIPAVKKQQDFHTFSRAGRELGELHVGYENVKPYPVTFVQADLQLARVDDPARFYRVEKMKFGGKQGSLDRSVVHYNPHITMTDIPLEAYNYVVNGKPALKWVMDQQRVKVDKKSGIVNDANDYANETVGDPRYPLDLFCRVITVSLETMRIVQALPRLDVDTGDGAPLKRPARRPGEEDNDTNEPGPGIRR